MRERYRMYQRNGGSFYAKDRKTGQTFSLATSDQQEANRLLAAKNQAVEQPCLNVAMAKVYLSAQSPEFLSRTWDQLIELVAQGYQGPTANRWRKFAKSAPLKILFSLPLYQTEAVHFLAVLDHKKAGVSTNVWLRILHNRALDLGWLLSPVLNKRVWPKVKYKTRRAITADEHAKVMESEKMEDYAQFFRLLWETGGSQTDIANLCAEDIDWPKDRLYYSRRKLASRGKGKAALAIGDGLKAVLQQLPSTGPLFPRLRLLSEDERASHFRAAMELHDKLKIQADTVQQLLVNEKLQEQVSGRTLLVDEAGLLSVRQMHELFLIAERQKCRVLLVGDVKQHHSVEAGDALRALQKYAGLETIRLKEIHRQKEAEYKKVVKLLADKKPRAAFTKLDRLGGVCEEKDWNKLLDQAAASYADKIAQGQSCLAISPLWAEVNAFTAVLRDQLKDKGLLGRDEKTYKAVQSMQRTPAAKMQLSNYQIGDILTFHRECGGFQKHEIASVVAKDARGLTLERANGSRSFFDPQENKSFDVGLPRTLAVAPGEKMLVRANFAPGRLKNGDVVTVKEVKEDGSLVLKDDRTIPPHFRQFTHGYASTSHSAQSKTVDHGILVLGDKSYQAANLQQAYVSNSRFRQTQTIFTTDKERAFNTMTKFEERPLAVEITKPTTSDPPQKLEEGRVPIQKPEKVIPPAEQRNAESLDWNPVIPKHGVRI